MTLAIKVLLVIFVVVLLTVSGLRFRKLRRDEQRQHFQKLDRRLVSPPPSPYTPSKGFRLLDGSSPIPARPEPSRPRLEPEHEYVFSETQLPPMEEHALAAARHDTQWALSRSAHRSRVSPSSARVGVIAIVAILVVGAVGYYAEHLHGAKSPTSTSSTTTTVRRTTTSTLALPSSFVAKSVSGNTATYEVPRRTYAVTVNGAAGAVWTVYRMGPNNTLEFQGTVPLGQSKTLTMTGTSQITLGSPKSATVSVAGSPVTFPTPLVAPLILVFSPATTSG
jgi:hypothetical protein